MKKIFKRIALLKKSSLEFDCDDLLRWSMLTRKSLYETYFNSIINSGYEITGDISPQYYSLTAIHYEYIRKSLEGYGFNVRVIYLIREPVERIWSNVRMEKNLYSSISKEISDSDAIKLYFKKNKWRFHSKYNIVIDSLSKAFKKENIYIGVYEEMFTKDKVKELSDFIGIDYNPTMIEKK